MSKGRSVVRDPETGKFVSASLDSETAREMGKRSHAKNRSETAGALLAEAGFDEDNQAPEHLKVLARLATDGRSGAVAALRDFRRLTSISADEPGAVVAEPGTVCPTCKQLVTYGMRITTEGLDELKGFVAWVREHSEPEPGFAEFIGGRRL